MLNSIIFFVLIASALANAEDDCLQWFKNSGVQPISRDCPIKCNLIDTDMGSFMCPNRCDEFCKPPPKCKPDPFWLEKIKNDRPKGWPNETEVSTPWTKEDKDRLLAALSQQPDQLKNTNLRGIFRMKKSIQIVNPGTEIDGSISLYDYAFNGPFSLNRVLTHELAHSWYRSTSKNLRAKYQKAAGWFRDPITKKIVTPVDRAFVNRDAKESPDEDFAHNIDTYLFEPETLRKAAPKVSAWIAVNFSKDFSLKTECKDHGKK